MAYFQAAGRGLNSPRSIKTRKCFVRLAASARSCVTTPTSMFRSNAASVRFAEVMKIDSLSATIALAWRTPSGLSRIERSRVVEHVGLSRSRPVFLPEVLGKPSNKLVA
jgi:hypothetical protein